MPERPITTKISPMALRLLRLIAAATGEKQYEALDRVLADEARRLKLPAQELATTSKEPRHVR